MGIIKSTFIHGDVNKLTKGSMIKEITQGKWIIINPTTKTHCVSDCLAILELYRSNKNLIAMKRCIKQRGDEIADKYAIREGCPSLKLQKISEDFDVPVVMGSDT